jgi:ADP-ribose pyrophosphatase
MDCSERCGRVVAERVSRKDAKNAKKYKGGVRALAFFASLRETNPNRLARELKGGKPDEENPMSRSIVYDGRRIRVAIASLSRTDGRTATKEIVLHPGAVAILPLIDDEQVCLLRNFRFPLGETLWEIPAGTLEPGEDVLHAAQRELAEETGYRAAQWEKLTAFYPSPGIMDEVLHVFVASSLTPGSMRLEVDEQIEPQIVPLAQALAWVQDGTIRDAKTMIAMLLWKTKKQ